MPQLVLCKDCGAILYQGDDIKTPDEVIEMHNGKCPKCGRALSIIPHKIEVKPAPRRRKL